MSAPVDRYRPGGSSSSYNEYEGRGRDGGGRDESGYRDWRSDERDSYGGYDYAAAGAAGNDWEQDVRERQRIPPPREEQRWERDRYDGNERGYNYDHRGSHQAGPSSLLRFPSPHEHYPSAHHRQPYHPDNEGRRPSYRNTRSDGNDTGSSYDLPQKPRKRIATPPNQSVILIGIPVPAAEEDVKSFIDEFRSDPSDPSPVENVVIVRDKATGQSKRFGFVRFISLEHARAFVEANFDHVFWRSRGSHDITEEGTKVRLDYATVDKRPGENVPQPRNIAPRESYVPSPAEMNDGSKDMGSSANRTLLLRGLDPLTKEGDIARSLEGLDEAMRERVHNAQGPQRIVLIKDKETNASWCFAFAIYPDEECAKAALRVIMDPSSFPTGYTIQQRLVAVTFARLGCFSQAYAKTTWSFSEYTPDGKKQEWIYWDDAAYGNVYDSPSYQAALARKKEEEDKQNDVDAFLSSLESEHPTLRPEDEVVAAPPKIDLNLAGALGPPGSVTKDKKKGGTELIISKKIAVDISKWNQKKVEMETPTPVDDAHPDVSKPTVPERVPIETKSMSSGTLEEDVDEPLKFADVTDTKLPKCLLCQRQFKSIEVLEKHNEQSALHKTNLEDSAKVAAALEAVNTLPASSSINASAYRDRALERRAALNQPEHPQLPPAKRHKKNVDPAAAAKAAVSAPEKQIEESNIGSKLLANMGWTAGAGLGNTQVGRAEPVQAKAFVAGAGIGASRGVNASEQAGDVWRGSEHGRSKARQRMLEEQK